MKRVRYQVIFVGSQGGETRFTILANLNQIQAVFDRPSINMSYPLQGMYLGHISKNKGDEACFDKRNISSLEIRAGTTKSANKCAEYLKLPKPFNL